LKKKDRGKQLPRPDTSWKKGIQDVSLEARRHRDSEMADPRSLYSGGQALREKSSIEG
jgi:hypothetical protein